MFPLGVGTGKDLSKPAFPNRCRLSGGGGGRAHIIEIRSQFEKLVKVGVYAPEGLGSAAPPWTCFSRAKK